MNDKPNRLSGLSPEAKQALLKRIVEQRSGGVGGTAAAHARVTDQIPESHYVFERLPQYTQLHLHRAVAERLNIKSPFFVPHDGIARDTTEIGGRTLINFGTYNYLDLNGDPRITTAAAEAMARYGTSASASRLVSGERPPHRALERTLAALHGAEDAVAFVSGHATNVAAIGTLMGPRDLILYDRLAHNSILLGTQLSGATRQSFPHNDWQAADRILADTRRRYEKVLIVVEGIYSMDGDVAPLDRLVEVKRRHKCFLMVDEAHSAGVLGASGRGIGEHLGIAGADVDIWMGTLSKSFVSCGGYVAGSAALVELLKFTAPGFVYSVGMPPPAAAAAKAAIDVMLSEPERCERLRANGRLFLELAKRHGLDTGLAQGFNVVPVITGRSVLAGQLSNALFERGISVQPIIHPAVEERAARLRFFLSAAHTEDEIGATIEATAEELRRLAAEAPEG